ncbi:polyhydroxyalkanoate depolymerase [Salinarimonas soli]|uniref:Polyhydroxyalkanoate depolymerase n=1 Tax=Salinarimonas soli TaxID=1638099 RepID=A0A5B2V4B8_9HYPH|nr:polyhydroxyalkanoate depolymerase [Salinarimonas soli]KAA2233440.1 polyhydroxyalkanoate depolymerase [Salinarimonas soli]
MDLAYFLYETGHMMMAPARAASDATKVLFRNPGNPLANTAYGRTVAAGCELFERTTRRYGKPAFGLDTTQIEGQTVAVHERIVWSRPFCQLIHFDRVRGPDAKPQPKILLVAPMSGHYATLLRGTVEAFLPTHEVYITDWADARMVPLVDGRFDLDDYIDYVIEMTRLLGPDVHLMAVCQPSVPVLAAIARMEAENDPRTPLSMTLMGGPIDTRRSPTAVNKVAMERGTEWFERHCIVRVPPTAPGFWRQVYPGFLQLSGFMAMNLDRHINAHWDMFKHLVQGDGDSAEKHRDFYDEYLAVQDLTAEFYLQTVAAVFVDHDLPRGTMMHRDKPVDLGAIRHCAIMAVEGEKDDISGVGQTLAALDLTPNLPDEKKLYHLQTEVGHYGVFNGSRFRKSIAPRIAAFMQVQQDEFAAGRPTKAARKPALRKVVG